MGDDPCPVPDGTKGTVVSVDDIGVVHCKFDNGRYLGICPEVDSFHAIYEQEENLEPSFDETMSKKCTPKTRKRPVNQQKDS